VGSGAVRNHSPAPHAHPHGPGRKDCPLQERGGLPWSSQSGFTANAGTVSSILGKDDFILSDELNHASIIDGARLSRAKIKVFRHKDVAHCEELLARDRQRAARHKLVITDAFFSMDGDIGPVGRRLAALAEKIRRHHDGGRRPRLGRARAQWARVPVDHFGMHGKVMCR